jgi:putative transcriptional regulator
MTSPRFYCGQFLLAMPGIGDPRFEHVVIAMCSHDEDGALGIGIDRYAPGHSVHDLLEQFEIDTDGIPDDQILVGGPVEPQRGFVVHSLDWSGRGTIDVAGRWGLSGTIDILRVIGRPTGPSKYFVALGYTGWGAGQLEGEMLRHGWHLAEGDQGLLFNDKPEQRWEKAYRSTGIDPRMLAGESGHA